MENEIVIFRTDDETINVEVRFEDETAWLTQDQMSVLFSKSKSTINEHIKNVFKEGELDEKEVVRKFRITTPHGAIEGKTQSHEVNFYNLDVIISVGYRVKSLRGTQFRQWATKRLKEYIVKGFTMDDDRLKSWAEAITGKNSWHGFETSAPAKRYSTVRFSTFTPSAAPTIAQTARLRKISSQRCRTRCTTP